MSPEHTYRVRRHQGPKKRRKFDFPGMDRLSLGHLNLSSIGYFQGIPASENIDFGEIQKIEK